MLAQLMPDVSKYRPDVKFWIIFVAIGLFSVLLARPQFGSKLETVKRKGVEVIIALDISNSMLAQDVQPSRLEKAKRLISRLVDELDNDKVGMIVFAQAPDWHDGSVSSSWQILEADAPTKYYLSPAQCTHFLKLAEIAGCPPPKEIEALFLKQGGAYPSQDPFNASVCGRRPKTGRQKRSETASDYQLTLFPLF